jgi:hypothetical protein
MWMMHYNDLMVDFLYLDLVSCDRCVATDIVLEATLDELAAELSAEGIRTVIRKILIESADQAIQERFSTSPTIRVNGRDLQENYEENNCSSCGDLCDDTVDCRVWVFQGETYEVPPKAMLKEALISAARQVVTTDTQTAYVEQNPQTPFELPLNLKRFFTAKKQLESLKNKPSGMKML